MFSLNILNIEIVHLTCKKHFIYSEKSSWIFNSPTMEYMTHALMQYPPYLRAHIWVSFTHTHTHTHKHTHTHTETRREGLLVTSGAWEFLTHVPTHPHILLHTYTHLGVCVCVCVCVEGTKRVRVTWRMVTVLSL